LAPEEKGDDVDVGVDVEAVGRTQHGAGIDLEVRRLDDDGKRFNEVKLVPDNHHHPHWGCSDYLSLVHYEAVTNTQWGWLRVWLGKKWRRLRSWLGSWSWLPKLGSTVVVNFRIN